MSQQLQLQPLEKDLSLSQILRIYCRQYKQVRKRYSDGHNGRCAVGVIMSYSGWNGKDDLNAGKILLDTLHKVRHVGVDKNLLIDLNDSGFSFDQIADYLDRHYELPSLE
jgi:hypothetical protein